MYIVYIYIYIKRTIFSSVKVLLPLIRTSAASPHKNRSDFKHDGPFKLVSSHLFLSTPGVILRSLYRFPGLLSQITRSTLLLRAILRENISASPPGKLRESFRCYVPHIKRCSVDLVRVRYTQDRENNITKLCARQYYKRYVCLDIATSNININNRAIQARYAMFRTPRQYRFDFESVSDFAC